MKPKMKGLFPFGTILSRDYILSCGSIWCCLPVISNIFKIIFQHWHHLLHGNDELASLVQFWVLSCGLWHPFRGVTNCRWCSSPCFIHIHPPNMKIVTNERLGYSWCWRASILGCRGSSNKYRMLKKLRASAYYNYNYNYSAKVPWIPG